ncbi:MAG: sugar phosphate isomerase/epimerase [Planctomycetota bacterium]
MLRFGYITNGLADHTLEQAIELLSLNGYQGIGITLDHHHLDPEKTTTQELEELRGRLEKANLEPVIETGARYALDAKRKHWPSMVSSGAEDRQRRVDYYIRAIEIAAAIGAGTVSLWSGIADEGIDVSQSRQYLVDSLAVVSEAAGIHGVKIGFEPEPGMLIESLDDWRWLRSELSSRHLGLTVDLGHLAVTESVPLAAALSQVMEDVVNIHVDDGKNQVHEHLPLGAGEIDFDPLLQVLLENGYRGLALVELSRDAHRAPQLVEQSIRFLTEAQRRVTGKS